MSVYYNSVAKLRRFFAYRPVLYVAVPKSGFRSSVTIVIYLLNFAIYIPNSAIYIPNSATYIPDSAICISNLAIKI